MVENSQENIQSPFSTLYAQGKSQVEPHFFQVEVLDRYFENPLYDSTFYDFGGKFYAISDEDIPSQLNNADRVSIPHFGVGYNQGLPVICVFLIYLAELTSKHQMHWHSYQLESYEDCTFSRPFYDTAVLGRYSERPSVYQGLILEQVEVNRISDCINRNSMFRKTFVEKRPSTFHFLLRPTRKAFDEFVLMLTKMTVENINKDFFKPEFQSGLLDKEQKGTLDTLEDWLKKYMCPKDDCDIKRIIEPLRSLLKPRREYAHRIYENEASPVWMKHQRKLIGSVYESMTLLRQVLTHLAPTSYSAPSMLDSVLEP